MVRLTKVGFTVSALLVTFIFGVDSMWLMLFRNTYMSTLARIRDVGPRHLPGSNIPIRSFYTGVGLLDYWFAVMQTILANVTDGRAPRLSLYAFHFAGQLGSIVTVLLIEAMRFGNKRTIFLSFLPWGLAMTAYGYAVVMPIYGIAHLKFSPTIRETSTLAEVAGAVQIREYVELRILPSAVVLGYVVPVLLMALPIFPNDLHQLFVAAWHLFPVWVALSTFLLKSMTSNSSLTTTSDNDTHWVKSASSNLSQSHQPARERYLARAYNFACVLSGFTHLATLATIVLNKIFPSFLAVSTDEAISFSSVFVPPYWRNTSPMGSFIQGTLNLLQYDQYAGSIAGLIWGWGLYCLCIDRPLTARDCVTLAIENIAICLIFGPGAAVAGLLSRRDQQVLQITRKRKEDDSPVIKPVLRHGDMERVALR